MSPLELRRGAAGYFRVGHRGAAAVAPENTIAALEAALALGIDVVELDVVETSGRLVVAHSLGERVDANPTLDQALAFLTESSAPRVGIDLDLKGLGFEAEVVASLRYHRLVERAVVSSFFARALRAVRRLEPSLPTGLSYPHDRYRVSERGMPGPIVRSALAGMRRVLPYRIAGMLRRAEANAAMVHHLVLSRALVARCHAAEAAVFAWTVNDPADLERTVATGVDGVISDDPRLFSSVDPGGLPRA